MADLRVVHGDRPLVDGVSFSLAGGQVLALVGASGSGKTTIGLALLGERPRGAVVSGTVRVSGQDVSPDRPPAAGFVPQHPSSVLNPVRRVGAVLREIAAHHRPGGAKSEVDSLVADAARRARFPESLLRRYPHQLSGGQQQRVVLAQALVGDPVLIVADEPTTGQDAVTRDEVVAELAAVVAEGVAVVLLSHDLDVVRALADQVVVLRAGQVVEAGPAAKVLTDPAHEHTRALLATPPEPRDHAPAGAHRLRTTGLTARHGRATVLHDAEVAVGAGECLALVGRSGSGKTTFARCVAGLHPPSAGEVLLDGTPLAGTLRKRPRAQLAAVQYVFQDARASFDHHRTVLDQVSRTAVRLRGLSTPDAQAAALATLREVGLTEAMAARRPVGLSGGELQRAALARALLAEPAVLICDEITSGQDALTRTGILDRLDALRRDRGLTLVVITHDRAVVTRLADRVAVVHEGRIVEQGTAGEILRAPRHEATRRLLGEPLLLSIEE
ncbi:ABC transporter ATP-binding protein [Actinokineospora iranica]|uniref:ABC transporter ATP-binding protein n=1 Tax=Actinokineospora iranica TaxID=1271860 RepID=UPI001E33C1BA|nr:ATP-binding cassette domain-containing protein [Actinokineospora iranica]